jgi:hypothetical protein
MDLLRTVRLTVRDLLRQPGYTAATVLTLALAIGANSAIFSAVHGVLLTPSAIHFAVRARVVSGSDPCSSCLLRVLTSTSMFHAGESLPRVASRQRSGHTGSLPYRLRRSNSLRRDFVGLRGGFKLAEPHLRNNKSCGTYCRRRFAIGSGSGGSVDNAHFSTCSFPEVSSEDRRDRL